MVSIQALPCWVCSIGRSKKKSGKRLYFIALVRCLNGKKLCNRKRRHKGLVQYLELISVLFEHLAILKDAIVFQMELLLSSLKRSASYWVVLLSLWDTFGWIKRLFCLVVRSYDFSYRPCRTGLTYLKSC